MEKITCIGGVFIKSKNPQLLIQWYSEHLGVNLKDDTAVNYLCEKENSISTPANAMFFYKEDLSMDSKVTLNFRVKNLNKILHDLDTAGYWIAENIHYYDNVSVGLTMDPEGNKIELWEPKTSIHK